LTFYVKSYKDNICKPEEQKLGCCYFNNESGSRQTTVWEAIWMLMMINHDANRKWTTTNQKNSIQERRMENDLLRAITLINLKGIN